MLSGQAESVQLAAERSLPVELVIIDWFIACINKLVCVVYIKFKYYSVTVAQIQVGVPRKAYV